MNDRFPPHLLAFAKALETHPGTFAEKYDSLLDYAFKSDGQQLNVNQLRQLAGGGSATTGQAAIVRFQAKLRDVISTRLDMPAEIPANVAGALASAGLLLWQQASIEAKEAWDRERAAMRQELAEAAARAESAASAAQESQDRADQLDLRLQATIASLDLANTSTMSERALKEEAISLAQQRQQLLESSKLALDAANARIAEAQAELAAAREQHQAERHETRKAHMVEVDRLRTDARSAADKLGKDLEVERERTRAAEKRTQESLMAQGSLQGANDSLQAQLTELKAALAKSQTAASDLAAQLSASETRQQATQESLDQAAADRLRLNAALGDLRQELGAAKAAAANATPKKATTR